MTDSDQVNAKFIQIKESAQEQHKLAVVAEKLHQDLKLEYRYFRFRYKGKMTSVSIGYIIGNSTIEYAVALQSRKDTFCKKTARMVIEDRFFNHATVVFLHGGRLQIDADLLIAGHYNKNAAKHPGAYDMHLGIPQHLRRIPIKIGDIR